VLFRQRPYVGLIPCSRSPTKCRSTFISSEAKILNRPCMAYTMNGGGGGGGDDDDKKNKFMKN
jgi:hypothetical protein